MMSGQGARGEQGSGGAVMEEEFALSHENFFAHDHLKDYGCIGCTNTYRRFFILIT